MRQQEYFGRKTDISQGNHMPHHSRNGPARKRAGGGPCAIMRPNIYARIDGRMGMGSIC